MNVEMTVAIVGVGMAIFSALIAWIALDVSVRALNLKIGARLRGGFGISSDCRSKYTYIDRYNIQNQKDRSIAVLGVFLRISPDLTIEVESFPDQPLIIEPFHVVHRRPPMVNAYVSNMTSVSIDNALEDYVSGKSKGQFVAWTTEGAIPIKDSKLRGNPRWDKHKNPYVKNVAPYRSYIYGDSYGENLIYLITLFKDGQVVKRYDYYGHPIDCRDLRSMGVKEVDFQDVASLEARLNEILERSPKAWDDFEILKTDMNFRLFGEPIQIPRVSWIKVNTMGRIIGKYKNMKARLEARSWD